MTVSNTEETDLWHYEREAVRQGYVIVAGVDEAGRGPLAGPVVAAAVILPADCDTEGICDSKVLPEKKREAAYERIRTMAVGIGVAVVDSREIDRINILRASYLAMKTAISDLGREADIYLIDGYPIPGFRGRQLAIFQGDGRSYSIAAASIVAKVTRDRIMCEYDAVFPQYGFARHKGYCTDEHIRNLRAYGACEIHRRSFGPVAQEMNPLWQSEQEP